MRTSPRGGVSVAACGRSHGGIMGCVAASEACVLGVPAVCRVHVHLDGVCAEPLCCRRLGRTGHRHAGLLAGKKAAKRERRMSENVSRRVAWVCLENVSRETYSS